MKSRTILVWSVFLVAMVLGYNFYEYSTSTRVLKKSWIESTRRAAYTLSEILRPLILMNQGAQIETIIKSQLTVPEIAGVSVYQVKGETMSLLVSSCKDERGQISDLPAPVQIHGNSETRLIQFEESVLGKVEVVAAAPLLNKQLQWIMIQTLIRVAVALVLWAAILRLILQQSRIVKAEARARAAAESVSRAKTAFLANLSHELRTPMNAIIGYSELLLEEAKAERKEARVNDLDKIHSAAQNLLGLINNLLSFTSIESGKWKTEESDFSLLELTTEILDQCRYQTLDKPLEIESVVSPDLPPVLHGDANAVREILKHLLSNAIKFTREGKVTLSLHFAGEHQHRAKVDFCVQDTGIGMRPEEVSRVFAHFETGESTASRSFGGVGIGLAICNSLVEKMGGHILVESQYGKGSRFHFTLLFDSAKTTTTDPIHPH